MPTNSVEADWFARTASDYGPWLTLGAIVFSALVALGAIYAQKLIARKRATLDIILRTEADSFYRGLYSSFQDLRKAPHGFQHLATAESKAESKARNIVQDYLNHYELIAIGCRQGILDEKFYCDWMRAAVVRDWVAAVPYVRAIRKLDENPTYYCELERLARRWYSRDLIQTIKSNNAKITI